MPCLGIVDYSHINCPPPQYLLQLHAIVQHAMEYKNLRVGEETFAKLQDEKRDYETWDGFFHRALEAMSDD